MFTFSKIYVVEFGSSFSDTVLEVWMDGHGRCPGTYFQYVLASSHFLGDFGGILESVHALLFSHFKYCSDICIEVRSNI